MSGGWGKLGLRTKSIRDFGWLSCMKGCKCVGMLVCQYVDMQVCRVVGMFVCRYVVGMLARTLRLISWSEDVDMTVAIYERDCDNSRCAFPSIWRPLWGTHPISQTRSAIPSSPTMKEIPAEKACWYNFRVCETWNPEVSKWLFEK